VATNITIRFTSGALTAATSGPVAVSPAGFSRLLALLPGRPARPTQRLAGAGTPSATAGANTAVRVLATDDRFNLVSTATIRLASTTSDPNADLPANVALVNGTNTLNVVFRTSGGRTVTVAISRTGRRTANTNQVTVGPGPFVKLQRWCRAKPRLRHDGGQNRRTAGAEQWYAPSP